MALLSCFNKNFYIKMLTNLHLKSVRLILLYEHKFQ